MTEIDILIEDGTVVTMDVGRRVLENHSVAVKEEKIVEIGPVTEMRARYRARKTINARRKAIMPGLVDVHGHAGAALIKQVGERLPGAPWRDFADFIAHHTSVDWWHVDSLLCSIDKLRFGTTTSLYMLGTSPRGDSPEHAYKNAEAVDRVGVRGICAIGPSRPPWPHEYSYWRNGRRIDRMISMEATFDKMEETIATWNGRSDSRVKMWVAAARLLNENPNDPVYDPANQKYIVPQAEGIRRLMDKYNVGFQVHAYGTAAKFIEKHKLGLLGPKTVLAHGWPFDMDDVEILARTGTHVAHCPRAHRVFLNKGRLPVIELLEAGVTIGLGSDYSGSDRTWSLWEDIYFAARVHRRIRNSAGMLPSGKTLEMATIDGAKALGMDDRIGSIEAGKDADIIIVNLFTPHAAPFFMETQRLAYFVRGTDVETVMVQGQILMEDRKILTVDEDEILEWAEAEALQTIRVFGLEPLMRENDRFWKHARM